MGWMEFMISLCPASFRSQYGQEMLQVFKESHRDILQEEGRLAAFQHLVHSSADVMNVALKEHVQEMTMLKTRPKVLMLLLGLFVITLYSTLQYGYWNARTLNENVGFLSVFNPKGTRTDVTLQPEYGAVVAAIQERFPDSTIRIMDNRMDYGAFGGSKKVLSVAVLAPELDGQVIPGAGHVRSGSGSSSLFRASIVKLKKRQVELFEKDLGPILNTLNFANFDVQSLCIISHFKQLPTRYFDDPTINAWMGPLSLQYMRAEVWKGQNPQQPHKDSFMVPYHLEQLPLNTLQNPNMTELSLCNYVPLVSGSGDKPIQPEAFTGPEYLY